MTQTTAPLTINIPRVSAVVTAARRSRLSAVRSSLKAGAAACISRYGWFVSTFTSLPVQEYGTTDAGPSILPSSSTSVPLRNTCAI